MTAQKSDRVAGKAAGKSRKAQESKPKSREVAPAPTITPKQQRFVEEYLVDLNATQAAIRAGYSPKTAGSQAFDLLKKPEIQHAVDDRRKKLAETTKITPESVLQRWWDLANADPNELVQYRRECCRHCHGENHEYQWIDEAEHERAVATALANAKDGKQPVLPGTEGGFGFNEGRDPHPECPKCNGDGYGRVFAQDTRRLKGAAKMLYDGVKQTKEGLEIKMLDRSKALENVARHLGMFNDKLTLKGDAENPLTMLLQQVSGTSLKIQAEPKE